MQWKLKGNLEVIELLMNKLYFVLKISHVISAFPARYFGKVTWKVCYFDGKSNRHCRLTHAA